MDFFVDYTVGKVITKVYKKETNVSFLYSIKISENQTRLHNLEFSLVDLGAVFMTAEIG